MGPSAAAMVVIADDDIDLLGMLEYRLNEWGFAVRCASSKAQLREVLAGTVADLLLLDLQLGHDRGLDVLSDLLRERFVAPVIILTAHGTIESAVQAIKLGAHNYVTKPPNLQQLRIMVQQAVEHHRCKHQIQSVEEVLEDNSGGRPMLGNSPKMQSLRQMIADAAPTNATVLILGESGTGKELVARAIHDSSQRSQGMFVPVNMAAVPANLAEALLFGHEKGSFTGADSQQQGWCQLADNGTLFLDELGEMDIGLQAKILRFLQERQIQRVGSNRGLSVDVRIVAATNRDPLALIREGRLREDLYYRLNVLPIELPPLRERREDIPLLATYFMRRAAKASGKRITAISPEVMQALQRYDWPGNIRELDNLLQRLVILCRNSHILPEQLPPEFLAMPSGAGPQAIDESAEADGLKPMARMEKQAIQDALDSCEGNVVQAAQILGVSARPRFTAKSSGMGLPCGETVIGSSRRPNSPHANNGGLWVARTGSCRRIGGIGQPGNSRPGHRRIAGTGPGNGQLFAIALTRDPMHALFQLPHERVQLVVGISGEQGLVDCPGGLADAIQPIQGTGSHDLVRDAQHSSRSPELQLRRNSMTTRPKRRR